MNHPVCISTIQGASLDHPVSPPSRLSLDHPFVPLNHAVSRHVHPTRHSTNRPVHFDHPVSRPPRLWEDNEITTRKRTLHHNADILLTERRPILQNVLQPRIWCRMRRLGRERSLKRREDNRGYGRSAALQHGGKIHHFSMVAAVVCQHFNMVKIQQHVRRHCDSKYVNN